VRNLAANDSLERKRGSGRRRILDEYIWNSVISYTVSLLKRKNKVSCSIIQDHINELYGVKVSVDTISRRLNESEQLKSKWQQKKAYVSAKNQKLRVRWAKEHRNWSVEQWRKVIWSDESPFVYRYNCRQRTWVVNDGTIRAENFTGTVKHDKKINVWGSFSRHGVGKIHLIKGIMDQHVYHGILVNQLKQSVQMLFPGQNNTEWIFQEDNDPKHTSKKCQGYIRSQGINRMWWPAQSPDLNPIENLWAILNKEAADRKPQNDDDLFAALETAWYNIDRSILEKLVDSMPRRCALVIKSNGLPIDY
jgi:hypothetical protein